MERKSSTALWRKAGHALVFASLAVVSFVIASQLRNVPFWLATIVGVNAGIFAIGHMTWLFFMLNNRTFSLRIFQNMALALSSVMVVVVFSEAFLVWHEQGIHKPNDRQEIAEKNVETAIAGFLGKHVAVLLPKAVATVVQRRDVLTLPAEWERRRLSVEGAKSACIWHGALHVLDNDSFRRTTPFPPKRPDRLRLMIVGDSLTYGEGIDETFVYPTLLQNTLSQRFNIEVLNLGIKEIQSEDILNAVRRFLPDLQPDLIFYGVCQNDFLPSGGRQYTKGVKFPLPHKVKKFMIRRTRFARFLDDSYDAFLRRINLRTDFYDDILENFEGYQHRFARDVAEMNTFVTDHGLPPVIAMVLDQFPVYKERSYHITKAAEDHLKKAGMDVIETEEYYRRFSGRNFQVSLWEGHPNEEANAIFASLILDRLQRHPSLQPYRKRPLASLTEQSFLARCDFQMW